MPAPDNKYTPEPSFLQKLAALLKSSPGATLAKASQQPQPVQPQPQPQPQQVTPAPQPPQLGGMSGRAQQILQSLPYQLHVQEAQAMGEQPLPPEVWAAQQQGR